MSLSNMRIISLLQVANIKQACRVSSYFPTILKNAALQSSPLGVLGFVLYIENTLVFIWKTQINKARESISTNKLWGKNVLVQIGLARVGALLCYEVPTVKVLGKCLLSTLLN